MHVIIIMYGIQLNKACGEGERAAIALHLGTTVEKCIVIVQYSRISLIALNSIYFNGLTSKS
jgi:hypothetical protein